MTRVYYLKHKTEMENTDWVPFEKMALYLKNALESVPKDQLDVLDAHGIWRRKATDLDFLPGQIYRISPGWTGPAEPPKPKYTDCKVSLDKSVYRFIDPEGDSVILTAAPAIVNFAGYVYFAGTPTEASVGRLIFTDQPEDKTVRLKVPDAVRFQV